MSVLRYWLAWLRFQVQCQWLISTGRGHRDAPDSLERAYNRQVDAWYRMERSRTGGNR